MSLTDLYAAVRAATRAPADWDTTVDTVVASVRPHLPHRRDVLAQLPIGARHGHEFSVPLHVEPDGTFSVVAFVSRPGQATSVHDHTTWCVVAVIDGAEREERFRLGRAGTCLEPIGDRVDESGAVSGFAPPGDIHRVRNCGAAVGVSLHIYGTDLRRTGSSVRRTYDLPIVTPTKGAGMNTTTVSARILDVSGGRIYHEIRGTGPLVALVGAPMDARPFAALADRLAVDHTVLTADPRGISRSWVDDRGQDSTPEMRADDLSRLIASLDAGPAAVMGSSGGAVTALALVQARPDLVHTVIAHEPPLSELLDDRDRIRTETDDYVATYLAGDVVGAWTMFLAQAGIDLPPGAAEQMFGPDRDPQDIADERFWFAHELRASDRWIPDLPMLRRSTTRIVVGVGADSAGQVCDRTAAALATQLGIERTTFPGDHTGFVQEPDRFAARLREVLQP